MSGFANSILAGASKLIRAAIQSPNYVAGLAGWTINKDGTSEFNSGTFRGTVSAATIIGALIESSSSGRRTTLDNSGDIKVYNASGAVLFWYRNALAAMFFYTDTGSATQGSLVQSISAVAGTDPFGNAYGAGFESFGSLGTAALIDSAIIGLFSGLNRLLAATPSGLFVYDSTTPTQLLNSIASAAGTDSQSGQSYPQGLASFIAGTSFEVVIGPDPLGASFPALYMQQTSSSPSGPPRVITTAASSSGCEIQVKSGKASSGATEAITVQNDSATSGVTNGTTLLQAGKVSFGNSGAAFWDDNASQLSLPTGGGPFINGEGFHTLSNPSGFTGTCRVKLVPWNMVIYDIEGTTTGSGTFTFGSPPSSSYNPTTGRHLAVGQTAGTDGRLFVPTSGGPQLIVSAAGSFGGCFMIPTN